LVFIKNLLKNYFWPSKDPSDCSFAVSLLSLCEPHQSTLSTARPMLCNTTQTRKNGTPFLTRDRFSYC